MRWDGSSLFSAACCCSRLLIYQLLLLGFFFDNLLLLQSAPGAGAAEAFLETRGCNRTVRNSVGWIRWTGRMGRCVVRIKAPTKDPQQMIEMRIRRMQVGVLKNARCEGAYVQFSDDPEDVDESGGRYCGHVTGNTTRLFLRRGPDLTVVLDSESRFAADNPVIFSAQFSILPSRLANERHHVQQQMQSSGPGVPMTTSMAECPLECQQRNDRRTCRLVSPGYPGVYPRGIRCRVALESGAGRFRIGGAPEDTYNLMNHTSQEACRSEFCEQEHVHAQEAVSSQLPQSDQPAEQQPPLQQQQQSQQSQPRQQKQSPRINSDRDEEDEIIIGGQPLLETPPKTPRLKKHQHQHQHQQHQQHHRRRSRGQHRPRDLDDIDKLEIRSRPTTRARHHRKNDESSERLQLPVDGFDRDDEENEDDDDDGDDDDLYDEDDDSEDDDDLDEIPPPIKPKKHHRNNQLFWSKNKGSRERSGSALYNHPNHQERPQKRRRRPHDVEQAKLGSDSCVGDYLALLESVNGRVLEIGKFCGEGKIPQILSRGRNIIVEFHAERDGTIMHDGFHLTIQESEAPPVATALASPIATAEKQHFTCDFMYRSTDKARDTVKSPRSWYPPNTLCTYRFTGKPNERVSVLLKIVREEASEDSESSPKASRNNNTLDYCPGNEIAVYNGTQVDGSFLLWSFCDATHGDINNIQVPIVSTGNILLIQFYSATGSYNGQDFTYSITYKFMKKPAVNGTKRRQVSAEETRTISLRPVDFHALNLTDPDNCNCDFADRIGNFKSWFIVLVVLGVISFVGAIITIIALLVKCAKSRRAEKKLLQTPQRAGSSLYYKTSVIVD